MPSTEEVLLGFIKLSAKCLGNDVLMVAAMALAKCDAFLDEKLQ